MNRGFHDAGKFSGVARFAACQRAPHLLSIERMNLSSRIAGGLVAILLMATDGSSLRAEEPKVPLLIAAAADLKFALADIAEGFAKAHPGIEVKTTFGSSGNLCAQIENGAPFDLFLSADMSYPAKLIKAGKADPGTTFLYATGHLVVWVPAGSKIDVASRGIQSLLDPAAKKIAIANPEHAPYGRAAVAALKSLGVYEQVQSRLVLGENVAQAAQFVQAGAADIGVFALSLALAPPMRDKGRFWEVPVAAYPKMEQGGVVLAAAKHRDEALRFRAWMSSAESAKILRAYGFVLPEP